MLISSRSVACDEAFPSNVGIGFDGVRSRNPDVSPSFLVEAKKSSDVDDDSLVVAGGTFSPNNVSLLPGNETYQARVRTCVPGVSGEPVCGKASSWSDELFVPSTVCQPVHFDAIAGDGVMTLRWDAQIGADEYEVHYVGPDDSLEDGVNLSTTDQHVEIRGLPDFVNYAFRVKAKGPSGESAWSVNVLGHTGNHRPSFLWPPHSVQEYPSYRWRGPYDVVFGWLLSVGGGAALHEVQIREVGTEVWTTLSSDLEVAGEGSRVIFVRDGLGGGDFGAPNIYGAVTGLIPGTEYELRVRGINGNVRSAWTEASSFTTLGRRPLVGTMRPPEPENLSVLANASEPFSRVVLDWDAADEDYLHEVRMVGGAARDWVRLQFGSSGTSSPHVVRYFGGSGVFIAGLTPGTEYHLAVRAARERNSSEQLDRSPWSEVVTLTTPGTRPANAPGSQAAPKLKAPPEDLMAEVNGTTVNLSWTATTNPNYTSQRLVRRVAGVSPIQWTEIPLADVNVDHVQGHGVDQRGHVPLPGEGVQGQRPLWSGAGRFRGCGDPVVSGETPRLFGRRSRTLRRPFCWLALRLGGAAIALWRLRVCQGVSVGEIRGIWRRKRNRLPRRRWRPASLLVSNTVIVPPA